MGKYKHLKCRVRRTWDMNPVTKVKHSRKTYDRNQEKIEKIKIFEEDLSDDELYEY